MEGRCWFLINFLFIFVFCQIFHQNSFFSLFGMNGLVVVPSYKGFRVDIVCAWDQFFKTFYSAKFYRKLQCWSLLDMSPVSPVLKLL